jgi:hypothetical protein
MGSGIGLLRWPLLFLDIGSWLCGATGCFLAASVHLLSWNYRPDSSSQLPNEGDRWWSGAPIFPAAILRTVVDVATDVLAIADGPGLESFGVVGRSGGGPGALACASPVAGMQGAALPPEDAPWRRGE